MSEMMIFSTESELRELQSELALYKKALEMACGHAHRVGTMCPLQNIKGCTKVGYECLAPENKGVGCWQEYFLSEAKK